MLTRILVLTFLFPSLAFGSAEAITKKSGPSPSSNVNPGAPATWTGAGNMQAVYFLGGAGFVTGGLESVDSSAFATSTLQVRTGANISSSGTNQTGSVGLLTGVVSSGAAAASGEIDLQTGAATGGGNTGLILLKTGAASGGGTRGKIKIQDGTEGTANQCLQSADTVGSVKWAACPGGISTPVSVANGGTGLATLTSHSIQVGAGAGNITQLAVGGTGQILMGQSGSDPTWTATPILGVSGTTSGTLNIANGGGSGHDVKIQNLSTTTLWNFNLPATAGTAGQVLTSQGGVAADMTWTTPAGGSPGGSNTQLQYNNSGAFGGISAMVWDGTHIFFGTTPSFIGAPGAFSVWDATNTNAFIVGSSGGSTDGSVIIKPQSGYADIIGAQSNLAATQDLHIQALGNSTLLGNAVGGSKTTIAGLIAFANIINCAAGIASDGSGNLSCVASDAKLKNVKGMFSKSLEALKKIRPTLYTWKKSKNFDMGDKVNAGFIAQDVEKVLPEAVQTNKDGTKILLDRAILAALVNAVNELSVRLEKLEK